MTELYPELGLASALTGSTPLSQHRKGKTRELYAGSTPLSQHRKGKTRELYAGSTPLSQNRKGKTRELYTGSTTLSQHRKGNTRNSTRDLLLSPSTGKVKLETSVSDPDLDPDPVGSVSLARIPDPYQETLIWIRVQKKNRDKLAYKSTKIIKI